ncbi:MAG: hypothetical protein SFU99_21085, partial [Saprospiraceae bacterium]|nr:hypothetical protein [Saprospiraceae bacterium]
NTEMNQARYKLYEVAKELSQFKKDFPKGDSKEREQIFKATVENLLNQYEILCDYYLSNRINKDRFIKQRKLEIKQIVESEGTKEYFANPLTSNYQAVIEVYRELKNTI